MNDLAKNTLKYRYKEVKTDYFHSRRPSKRHSAAAAAVAAQAAQAAMADAYSCCPPAAREDLLMDGGGSSGGGSRSSSGRHGHHVTPQSYATLRGRKWTDKQRAGCTSTQSGIGDNYGRTR